MGELGNGSHACIVIGAGQSGLATGYFLAEWGLDFVIVADDDRIGDTWRNRWDSLRLFTPAFYDGLPGMAFPADDPESLPTKDEVAAYLESYAEAFDLPVRLSTRVTRVGREDGRFRVETTGAVLTAETVVVATGAHSTPSVPPFADDLGPDTFSCHSSEYENTDGLPDGDVLVVGAGNSGTQIAAEVGAADPDRRVWLAGRDTGTLPRRVLGRDVYRFLAPTLFRISRGSLLGRRLHRRTADRGDPVFAPEAAKLEAAGVERIGRINGIEDGRPVTAGGDAIEAAAVIWATGFQTAFPWIDLPGVGGDGEPRHTRGVADDVPGLSFVGLPWQHRLSSSLIGGVGEDAEYVARSVRSRIA